jgi:hypothetical protein
MLKTEVLALLTAPESTARYEHGLHATKVLVEALPRPVGEKLMAEQVAKVLASVPTIRMACTALQQAGWNATSTGNRITVNHEVEAHFIVANGKTWWQVYAIDGTPPEWIVGGQMNPAIWMGCVE